MENLDNNRRVIIAGGSIGGLTLAVALQAANIDFCVLERESEIAPQLGASTGCHPHGQNLLHQLGVLEAVEKIALPIQLGKTCDEKGRYFEENITVIKDHIKRYGFPTTFITRRNLIKSLYAKIKDQSKVLVNKKVVDFTQTEEGILVYTEDKCIYKGTILVGADGIHSAVRGLLKAKAEEQDPGSGLGFETTNGGKPGFLTEYKCLFAISRTDETHCPIPPGQLEWSYGKGHCTTCAHGEPGVLVWFIWTTTPVHQGIRSPRFSAEDMEAVVSQYRDRKMTGSFTVGDAWDARIQAAMVAQEEGIIDKWSYGRVVLIGDAVHKMSVNSGLGAMTAMEGIAHLTNRLYPILSPDSASKSKLTDEKCADIFEGYRQQHMVRLSDISTLAAQTIRYETWAAWYHSLIAKYVMPWFSNTLRLMLFKPVIHGAPTFHFIPKDMSKPFNKLSR